MLPFDGLMKTFNRKAKQFAIVITLTISAIGFSGCSMFPQAKKYLSKNINVAGAFTHSPDSFAPVETGTLRLQSDELWYRRDFSGNKTTFLWGLFTFTDY
jgi:hypothetical protein|tara:strand:+ start:3333 stop:3632 length:300 start_codon:yes stop_codon:yes gene_type:complete